MDVMIEQLLLVERKGRCFVPDGGTVLEAGDVLLVSADHESSARLRDSLKGAGQDR